MANDNRLAEALEALDVAMRAMVNGDDGCGEDWEYAREAVVTAARQAERAAIEEAQQGEWWKQVTEACGVPLGEGYPDCLAPRGHNEHADGLGHIFDGYELVQRYPGWKPAAVPAEVEEGTITSE